MPKYESTNESYSSKSVRYIGDRSWGIDRFEIKVIPSNEQYEFKERLLIEGKVFKNPGTNILTFYTSMMFGRTFGAIFSIQALKKEH